MKYPPGTTLGILGGGQLGKMIAMEARPMGYRIAILDPDPTCPARSWTDHYVQGTYTDEAAIAKLAEASDVLTLETEHVPASFLDAAAKIRPMNPSPNVLRSLQDRLAQRKFLASHKLAQPKWAEVSGPEGLAAALVATGTPAVLKTRTGGYDGKGQARVRTAAEGVAALASLDNKPAVAEEWITFEAEVAATLVRTNDGQFRHYPLARTVHRNGILHTAQVPANVSPAVEESAKRIAQTIADKLGHVGVLCVEFFMKSSGELLVNEIAPRVHNSGHYSMGATTMSQFEAHARAVLGLPVPEPRLLGPVTMLNLLGDLWHGGEPDLFAVIDEPRARLHLYGKRDARPGRKMGHVLIMDSDGAETLRVAEQLHSHLAKAATKTERAQS